MTDELAPMLERRRIEAEILSHVYETVKAAHGVEEARRVIADAVRRSAIAQGQAMAHACVAKSVFTVGVPSLEIKVSFLSAASPGLYRSYGWVVKWGRSVAFLEGELRDEDGALIARASSTAALRHLKK